MDPGTMGGMTVKAAGGFVIIAMCLFLAGEAYAGCGITASTGITFPNYDVFAPANTDGTGTITVICNIGLAPPNPPVNVAITISASPNSGGINPRRMKEPSSGDLLNYNVYTDSNRTIIWNNVITGGPDNVVLNNMGKNSPARSTTVYGRIFPGQDVSVGSYTDALTVTITW